MIWCYQKHLRWTIDEPLSSYSSFVIQLFWKVDKDDKIEPPIQTKNFLSGGAIILTALCMAIGTSLLLTISLWSLVSIFVNIVVPPERTMLLKSSLLTSRSHLAMELITIPWKEDIYWPIAPGLKRASGHLKRWLPISITFPSGNSNSLWFDLELS